MINKPKHYIYPDKASLAVAVACDFENQVKKLLDFQEYVNIALSGGSTPIQFYKSLVVSNPEIDWTRVRFFWGDERCVPPHKADSNYGNAYKTLLAPLEIPSGNIFKIRGESDPEEEAKRYSDVLKQEMGFEGDVPSFDWIFIGMGADGHTLSIFPDQIGLWNDPELCVVATHPDSGQKRITFTGKLIEHAKRVTFLVTGSDKSSVVNKVIFKKDNYMDYPASLVKAETGIVEWHLDRDAAQLFA